MSQRAVFSEMIPQADEFDFIHKRLQELAKQRGRVKIEQQGGKEIRGQRSPYYFEPPRRRLPGENPSS
jgi:hypothetical protein